MKYIITGQSMMWLNMASVIIGYLIFRNLGIESIYVQGVMGAIGAIGSGANMVFSIILQVHGYQELKVIDKYPY